ncbi:MAG: hypothetical protein WKF79_13655 [Nocardioides sp.]
MRSTPVTVPLPAQRSAPRAAERRIRHQARDAAALMAFSAITSVGFAGCFLLLARLGLGR